LGIGLLLHKCQSPKVKDIIIELIAMAAKTPAMVHFPIHHVVSVFHTKKAGREKRNPLRNGTLLFLSNNESLTKNSGMKAKNMMKGSP